MNQISSGVTPEVLRRGPDFQTEGLNLLAFEPGYPKETGLAIQRSTRLCHHGRC